MKQQRMNLLLRILFIVLIIAISGAAILQIFAPEYMRHMASQQDGKEKLVSGI